MNNQGHIGRLSTFYSGHGCTGSLSTVPVLNTAVQEHCQCRCNKQGYLSIAFPASRPAIGSRSIPLLAPQPAIGSCFIPLLDSSTGLGQVSLGQPYKISYIKRHFLRVQVNPILTLELCHFGSGSEMVVMVNSRCERSEHVS